MNKSLRLAAGAKNRKIVASIKSTCRKLQDKKKEIKKSFKEAGIDVHLFLP